MPSIAAARLVVCELFVYHYEINYLRNEDQGNSEISSRLLILQDQQMIIERVNYPFIIDMPPSAADITYKKIKLTILKFLQLQLRVCVLSSVF